MFCGRCLALEFERPLRGWLKCFWLLNGLALLAGQIRAAEGIEQLLNLGQAAQRNGDLGEALILAGKAISAEPKNPQW
jgi:hypothetical protein